MLTQYYRGSKPLRPAIIAVLVALLPGAAVSIAAAAQPLAPSPLIINSEEKSGLYTLGKEVVFTIKLGESVEAVDWEKVVTTITRDGWEKIDRTETKKSDTSLTVRFTPESAGWYMCQAWLPGESRRAGAHAGVVVSPEKFTPSMPEPTDFDEFWNARRTALTALPLKADLKPMESPDPQVECFSLEAPCPGTNPVRGYFVQPAKAKAHGCPAILYVRAAGVSGDWCRASVKNAVSLAKRYGAIVLDINAHGMLNDQPPEYYQDLEQNELRNYATQGAEDRDKFYFVGMYVRLLRSIEFIAAQEYWDGRHLITIGESQGGGQALAAAGLDKRVSAVVAVVPAMCDFTGPVVKRLGGWPMPVGRDVTSEPAKKIIEAVRYCDNVNLAKRSRAETLIFVGLADTTCSPPGVYATYNRLPGRKRIVAYPHKPHSGLPKEDAWLGEIASIQEQFIRQHIAQEADPYDRKALDADPSIHRQVVVYSRDNAPAAPKLEDMPLRTSALQYGITWTFEQPARVGQFINGDSYVVGPVTIQAIDPRPLYGNEIAESELDHMDKERPEAQRVRNGFMLNPPARMKVAYDSGVRNWFDPALIQRLPVKMKPGDSLVATISMPKDLVLNAQLRNKIERGVDDSSPIRTTAVLTCVSQPQPPDAFRPAFCDRSQRIYLARNLKRDRLPTAAATKSIPRIDQYIRFTQRPWVGTGFFGFEEPVENMPQYGLEYGRVSGITALLLCTDLTPEQKEPLLVNYIQVGIDLGGMIRAGHPGWTGWGGHGSGRKLPIVFAGILLGDDELAGIHGSFPKVSFGEDEQTAYGDCWTGAKVVFTGHSGIDAATGEGRSRGNGWGPYEHLPPAQWKTGQNTSESYRRCCTSIGWVAQALALRLLHAEKEWDHDAFFDYVDRWMHEDDTAFVRTIKEASGRDHNRGYARQGQAWDAFVNEMWAQHRPTLPFPTDGWRQPHDDAYYRAAITKSQ